MNLQNGDNKPILRGVYLFALDVGTQLECAQPRQGIAYTSKVQHLI